MKHYIFISLAVLTFIVFTPRAHALFGHVAAEKERRQSAEQQLQQEQQTSGKLIDSNESLTRTNQQLQTTIHVLAASVTVALIIGAAVGSKTRRDAHHEQ